MSGLTKHRLITEKRGFRVKSIKHPRYKYVVYRIEGGKRVEQTYFQFERAANSHYYRLKDLESEHLTDFLESRQISGRTWNNYRRDFHVTFAWAVDQKYLLTNPAATVPEAQEDPINAQVLSPDEFSKLLKSAEETLRPVLALQAFSGLRRSEVEQIEWPEIKFDTARIVPTKTKSGQWRYIVMRPNLKSWLEQVPKFHRIGRVCTAPYREALDRARLSAEFLQWPHNCLRHSFSSYSLVAEENEPRLQMELGHSSPRLLIEHYRAIVTPAHAEEWWKISPSV